MRLLSVQESFLQRSCTFVFASSEEKSLTAETCKLACKGSAVSDFDEHRRTPETRISGSLYCNRAAGSRSCGAGVADSGCHSSLHTALHKEKSHMNITREQLLLYAVTDRSWLKGETLYEQVERALKGGVTLVQLREKELSEPEFEAEGRSLLELCHRYRVPLIINDNVELAERIGADGVHVGQSDMELTRARKILGTDKIIGVTAKTIEQAQAAEKAGADYLGSGAVFGSSTKTDAKPMELTLLQEICQSVTIPVVAIGGINHDNILKLKGCEIAGAAVVSGIFACEDIEEGTKELLQKVNMVVKNHE